MNLTKLNSLLAVGVALGLVQTGTVSLCYAAEDVKSVQNPDPVAQAPEPGLLPSALLSLSAGQSGFSHFAFLLDKKTRTLTVWKSEGDRIHLVSAVPADIGAHPGDKLTAGDFKTPEGIYFFQSTRSGKTLDFSRYGERIFTLDYPNYFDRMDKKTGNGIWLHGIPDSKSLLRGSHGCVVVRNKALEELAQFIELKQTPIVVVNQAEYLSERDWLLAQHKTRNWLDDWRSSWGNGNLDQYMEQYADGFHSRGMNKAQWREHKKGLYEKYRSIEIDLKDVQIFTEGQKVVIRFLQSYKSDRKTEFGTKILYALRVEDKYKIVSEDWAPVRPL